MVSALKQWLKKWLGIDVLEVENLTLVLAVAAHAKRMEQERRDSVEWCDSTNKDILTCKAVLLSHTDRLDDLVGRVALVEEPVNQCLADCAKLPDFEARIAFLENSLTAKATTAKIVPKPHKATFRQFAAAASAQQETE